MEISLRSLLDIQAAIASKESGWIHMLEFRGVVLAGNTN